MLFPLVSVKFSLWIILPQSSNARFSSSLFLGKDKERDTRSKSQSKEPDREKRRSHSEEKERKSRGHSPAGKSDEDRVQSEGDTKKD